MHPPGPEKGKAGKLAKASGPLQKINSDDAENLTDTQQACNSKPLPPGYAWEGGSIVPCVMPPTEAEPLTDAQALLKIIGHACGWANGHPAKWQAFLVVAGYDTRTTREVADDLKISQRSFQLHVKEARARLVELRRELGSEGA